MIAIAKNTCKEASAIYGCKETYIHTMHIFFYHLIKQNRSVKEMNTLSIDSVLFDVSASRLF